MCQNLRVQASQRHAELVKALYDAMLAVLQVMCPQADAALLRTTEVDAALSQLLRQAHGEDHVGLRNVIVVLSST